MKRIIVFSLMVLCADLLSINCCNAAFNGLTIHSRANCLSLNETISWDWTHYWMLNTMAVHYNNGVLQHQYATGWQYTWRSAAVCWGEGRGGWTVVGAHYIAYKAGDMIPLGGSNATGCNPYNGWWDKNK